MGITCHNKKKVWNTEIGKNQSRSWWFSCQRTKGIHGTQMSHQRSRLQKWTKIRHLFCLSFISKYFQRGCSAFQIWSCFWHPWIMVWTYFLYFWVLVIRECIFLLHKSRAKKYIFEYDSLPRHNQEMITHSSIFFFKFTFPKNVVQYFHLQRELAQYSFWKLLAS